MIKIFMSVRNRLAITKKAIHALKTYSTIPHQIYVYNNITNYLLKEHFIYFMKLYEKGYISQVTFTSKESTFNTFSKAASSNFFGCQHECDPKKDSYNFLVILDNDIIVTPEWDKKILQTWDYINKNNLKHVKIVGQLPGGIKHQEPKVIKISKEINGRLGKLGGSGLWSVRPNFFNDIGILNLRVLIGHDKRHDQMYWRLLEEKNKGRSYIMGINQKLGIHCGGMAGSVCNTLIRNRMKKNKEELIKFEKLEEKINSLSFDEFYNQIKNNQTFAKDW